MFQCFLLIYNIFLSTYIPYSVDEMINFLTKNLDYSINYHVANQLSLKIKKKKVCQFVLSIFQPIAASA